MSLDANYLHFLICVSRREYFCILELTQPDSPLLSGSLTQDFQVQVFFLNHFSPAASEYPIGAAASEYPIGAIAKV
jgi:hypothetical protein